MNSLIKESIKASGKNIKTLAKLYGFFITLFVVLNFIIQHISLKINMPLINAMQNASSSMSFDYLFSAETLAVTKKYFPLLLIFMLAFAFLKFLYNCLIVLNIAKEDNTLVEMPKLPSIFMIFVTFILLTLMRCFGFLLFIIPGVIFSILLLMVPCVIVMENKTGFTSFDRSFQLVKKDIANTFIAVLFFWATYFCTILTSSICLSLIQTVLHGIIKLLSFNGLLTVFDNIFTLLSVIIDSVLYATLSIFIQNTLYIQYKRHSDNTQFAEQYEEKKYTLEDYYRGKEEEDEEE